MIRMTATAMLPPLRRHRCTQIDGSLQRAMDAAKSGDTVRPAYSTISSTSMPWKAVQR